MKQPLDIYDDIPREQRNYLSNYGWHFSERACKFATSKMKKYNRKTLTTEPLTPWSKEEVDALLKREGIKVENNILYDYVFVANMAKADYMGSSIEDELHVARFVRDYIDDPDAGEGFVMRRWYATMVGKGEPINWGDIL